ncbi:hypothetical protein GOP47_0026474 [Adiantum capillus-veneris]|nr:hypothetical protein GOP47_0026474 [Adiantum capillus-veneris]
MSLERNEQEEGPGAFLSLSGGQGSSSPFRGPPADSSPRVKQEQGDYLSLQQPSQESPSQLVHAQESWSQSVDAAEAPNVEKPLYEQNKIGSPPRSMPEELSGDKKESAVSENDKTSTLHPEEISFGAPSEQQTPPFAGHESLVTMKPSSGQQRPTTTWLSFVDQQKHPSSLGISQHQNRKEATSFGCLNPLSLHGVSDQKESSPLSLQVSPKQEKHGGEVEEEKATLLMEDEKTSPLQPSMQRHSSFLHRTGVPSPQLEHARDVPVQIPEQKISKGLTEQATQASSDQQRLCLLQQWHKSAFNIQAHMRPPHDGSSQGPLAEQKLDFLQGLSAQQTNFGSPKHQSLSPCDPVRSQQGFVAQSTTSIMQDRMGFCAKPNASSNHTDQSAFLREEELKLSMKSPFARIASSQSAERNYPSPMATHEAVLTDKRLFMETLQCLHAALNLYLSLPKVEGSDLDLHKLYKEVTSRGGLELVTNGRKWQDIARAFGFPLKSMNVLPFLEQTYTSTLYYYEQVYFMGASGKIVTLSSQSSALSDQVDGVSWEMESRPVVTNGSTESAQALNVDPTSSVGTIVSGAIDGKFEDGYLVTVMVGARKLRGVLYHVASTDIPSQNISMTSIMQSVDSEIQFADGAPKMGRKRKKREVFRKDPNAPRQNRTGYNFFFAEQRAKLKTMQPDKDRAISKMIGELWSKLSEDEKIPYQVKGVEDKERYVREMKEYKEKIKLPMIVSNESLTVNPPLHPQLPCSQISQSPHHDPKARASMFAFSYTPEGLNTHRCVPSQPPMALVSQPANTLFGAQTELPPTIKAETSKASEAGLLRSSSTTIGHADEREITRDTMNWSLVPASEPPTVITTNAATGVSTNSFSIVDPSTTSAVDMSKFLIDETSPKSLPQSENQDQAGGLDRSKKEEHVSAMEQ